MTTLTLICITIAWFKLSLFITICLRFIVGKINFMPVRFIFIFLWPITVLLIAVGTPMCMYLAQKEYGNSEWPSLGWWKRFALTFSVIFNELIIYNWD